MRTLVVTALVAFSVSVSAAAHAAPAYHAGFKGGVNIAELTGDGLDGISSKTGFEGGGFVGASFNQRIGARIEGLFVSRGAEGTIVSPGDDHPHESTWTVNDVEIPVVFDVRFPMGQKFHVNAFAGPSVAFNLKSEIETTHGTEDVGSLTKSVRFGGVFGAGGEYALSRLSLVADVRYGLGATSMIDDIAGQQVDVKDRGVGVMLGAKFPFGAP